MKELKPDSEPNDYLEGSTAPLLELLLAEGRPVAGAISLVSVAGSVTSYRLPGANAVVGHAAAASSGRPSNGGGGRVVQTGRGLGEVRGVAAGVGPDAAVHDATALVAMGGGDDE